MDGRVEKIDFHQSSLYNEAEGFSFCLIFFGGNKMTAQARNRSFNYASYLKNNARGVVAASNYLTNMFPNKYMLKTVLSSQKEKFKKGDFLIFDKILKESHFIEVEVREGWFNFEFKYEDVGVPERKGPESESKYYFSLNNNLNMFSVTTLDVIRSSEVVTRLCRDPVSGLRVKEPFYAVPLKECIWVSNINAGNTWKIINTPRDSKRCVPSWYKCPKGIRNDELIEDAKCVVL